MIFGVWLVYNDDMQKLYTKLIKTSDKVVVNINGQSEYYFLSFYEHDTNKICSWGYNDKYSVCPQYSSPLQPSLRVSPLHSLSHLRCSCAIPVVRQSPVLIVIGK
jgi:hypothetical protein